MFIYSLPTSCHVGPKKTRSRSHSASVMNPIITIPWVLSHWTHSTASHFIRYNHPSFNRLRVAKKVSKVYKCLRAMSTSYMYLLMSVYLCVYTDITVKFSKTKFAPLFLLFKTSWICLSTNVIFALKKMILRTQSLYTKMGKKRWLYFIYTWSLYSLRFIKDQSLVYFNWSKLKIRNACLSTPVNYKKMMLFNDE